MIDSNYISTRLTVVKNPIIQNENEQNKINMAMSSAYEACNAGYNSKLDVDAFCRDDPDLQVCARSVIEGRPYCRVANHTHSSEWITELSDLVHLPRNDILNEIVDMWLHRASCEHASVASFSIHSVELIHLGAPCNIVEKVHKAALDEIKHAELCYTIASQYSQLKIEDAGPYGPSEIQYESITPSTDPKSIFICTLKEACINETISAVEAYQCYVNAIDPVIKDVLYEITKDELGHADLGWETAAWMLKKYPYLQVECEQEIRTIETFLEDKDIIDILDENKLCIENYGILCKESKNNIKNHCLKHLILPGLRDLINTKYEVDKLSEVMMNSQISSPV